MRPGAFAFWQRAFGLGPLSTRRQGATRRWRCRYGMRQSTKAGTTVLTAPIHAGHLTSFLIFSFAFHASSSALPGTIISRLESGCVSGVAEEDAAASASPRSPEG